MKTSNKLLLGFFCILLISMLISNGLIKYKMGQVLFQNEKLNKNIQLNELLKSHSQLIGNSLYIDSTVVILSIDKNASSNDLDTYRTKLKEINIDLKIEKIEFDSNNKIKFLSISVNCNDGYEGWASEDLSTDKRIGFFRNYEKDKKPFALNPLELIVEHSANGKETRVSIKDNMAMVKGPKVKTGLVNQKNKISLTIGQNTTPTELEHYRTILKERNIDFNVTSIDFDSIKQIKSIEISVNCNDGFKGTVKETLTNHKIVGFYRIYTKDSSSPFGMTTTKITDNDELTK